MQIRIIATGQEGRHGDLFPQTSFPGGVPQPEWMLENGVEEVLPTEPPPPTEEQIIANLTYQVQLHLDSVARQKNYDGILSACTYCTSTNAQFAAEGQACVEWRDAVWSACYAIMAEVKAGSRAIPTDIISELPAGPW